MQERCERLMNDNPFLALKPNGLQFETENRCNSRCNFCQYKDMVKRPPAKWSTILDILYNYAHKVAWIAPFGMQEPLLEPRLPSILAAAKQFNPNACLQFYSNMSVFPEETWKTIIKFQLLDRVSVSFYGVDKRTYNKLQPPLDFEETQRNIKRLMKLKRCMGWSKPIVALHLLITEDTYRKAGEFKAKWFSRVDEFGLIHHDRWCGLNRAWNRTVETQIWGPPAQERVPCYRPFLATSFRSDGTLVPCCLDHSVRENCGNVKDSPDLWWTSSRLNEIRRLHLEGKWDEVPLCRDCSLWLWETPKEWLDIVPQLKAKLAPCVEQTSTA